MILFLRMIMHIVVSPKGNKRKKILKKRDELEGIYHTTIHSGCIYTLRHHLHRSSFPTAVRWWNPTSPSFLLCMASRLSSFSLIWCVFLFFHFFVWNCWTISYLLMYIWGGLYSRPSVHSQLSKNKTCKNFAATNRWPFNQVVFCFYIQPCIISIYMCISHP